jgi:hypothetical protein
VRQSISQEHRVWQAQSAAVQKNSSNEVAVTRLQQLRDVLRVKPFGETERVAGLYPNVPNCRHL